MKWFKHYSDMYRGRSINDLLDKLGHTGLCFFLLQEMCAEKLERSNGPLQESDLVFQFHTRIVRQNLRISPASLARLLDVCAANGLLSFEFSGNQVEIKMPILLNLLDRDTKMARRTRAKNAQNTRLDKDKDKERDKDKELEEVFHTSSCTVVEKTTPAPTPSSGKKFDAKTVEDVFECISSEKRLFWLDLYGDESFITREVKKAFFWYADNERKKPKSARGWNQALSSWLDRAWQRNAKGQAPMSKGDLISQKSRELIRMVDEGEL